MTILEGGKVGIGTAAPTEALEVSGRILSRIDANAGTGADTGGSVSLQNYAKTSGQSWVFFNMGRGYGSGLQLWEYPATAPRITVLEGGAVGIGVTAPASMLHVAGDIRADGNVNVNGALGTGYLNVSQGMTINGNLGIGLNEYDVRRDGEPASPLVVRGDIRTIGNGNVSVSGDVLLTGADCAEDFDVSAGVMPEPGTVVIIAEDGTLRESQEAYDKKVAGVVSGAGEYRHGLVLDKRTSQEGRIPVALIGKVYCKVDAQYSPIGVGDLLTTSPTPGHAMKATEPDRVFGTVIGKALRSISGGRGLIPILISLQ